MDAIEKAQSEQATLESRLAEITLQASDIDKRLQDVKAFIKLYNEYQGASLLLDLNEMPSFGARPKSKKDQIIDYAKQLLADGRHRHTTEILNAIENSGIEITATDKVISISSILSKEKALFQSSRKHGWSLVKKEEISRLTPMSSDSLPKNSPVNTI